MKVIFTFLLLLAPLSLSSYAMNTDNMVEFSVAQMKRTGDFVELAEISGMDESRIENDYRSVLTQCLNENKAEDDALLEQCIHKGLGEAFGVSTSQLDTWIVALEAEQESLSPLEALYEKMELIDEKIFALEDKDGLTPAEEVQLDSLRDELSRLSTQRHEIQSREMQELTSDMESYLKKD